MDNKYSVIVVEDEKLIARNIARHIEEENPLFSVTAIYSNGEDALLSMKEQLPDVVFTDISMPVMTGLELAEKINELYANVKCVIVTGYADFEYARKAIHANVSDYLLKPIDTAELRKVLKDLELSLSAMSGDFGTNSGENGYTPEEIVTLIKNYIAKHYSEELDLNTIASELGFSSSYLTKVFNKVEQITPSKYIRNYRMGIAKQLLNRKDMTIAQVAAQIGYNDPFHFSKSFKLTFGISPTEYKDSCE